jgi:rhamnulokinase
MAQNAKSKLIAFDIGAESGRAIVGHFDGNQLSLEEMHRFSTLPVRVGENLYTDVLNIWGQIQVGLQKSAVAYGTQLESIGVDTWGVDYALLDGNDRLIATPYHYRDRRTDGILERAFARVPREEIYFQTGNQFMQFNTLFQLFAGRLQEPEVLASARSLLMLPDLLHFWLCGEKTTEFTNATTTQCFDQVHKTWAEQLLARFEIPAGIFQPISSPGSRLGRVHAWLGCPRLPVILPASHDTGSAVTAVPVQEQNFLYISSGTWSLVGVELNEAVISDESLAANLTNEGNPCGRTCFLKVVPGMWLLQQCKHEWQKKGRAYSYTDLTALAMSAPAHGPVLDVTDPLFVAPGAMVPRVQQFCQESGQSVPQSDGEVARCILESLAHLYRSLLEDFEKVLGKQLGVIHIIGGGSKNTLLNQLTADNCTRPVIAGPEEATAAGNLLVQAMGLGYLGSMQDIRKVVRNSFELVTFAPAHTPQWDDAYAHYHEVCRNVAVKRDLHTHSD